MDIKSENITFFAKSTPVTKMKNKVSGRRMSMLIFHEFLNEAAVSKKNFAIAKYSNGDKIILYVEDKNGNQKGKVDFDSDKMYKKWKKENSEKDIDRLVELIIVKKKSKRNS
jgi:hypothetical protein